MKIYGKQFARLSVLAAFATLATQLVACNNWTNHTRTIACLTRNEVKLEGKFMRDKQIVRAILVGCYTDGQLNQREFTTALGYVNDMYEDDEVYGCVLKVNNGRYADLQNPSKPSYRQCL